MRWKEVTGYWSGKECWSRGRGCHLHIWTLIWTWHQVSYVSWFLHRSHQHFAARHFFVLSLTWRLRRRIQWKRKVGNVLVLDSIIRYEAIRGFRGSARSRDIWQTHRAMKRISTQKTSSLISLLAIAASRRGCGGWRESSRCPWTWRALKNHKVVKMF